MSSRKSSHRSSSSLKQGKLSFASSKRAATTGGVSSNGKSSQRQLSRSSASAAKSESGNVTSAADSSSDSSSEESEFIVVGTRRAGPDSDHNLPAPKRRRLRTGAGKGVFASRDGLENAEGKGEAGIKKGKERAKEALNTGDKRWRKLYGIAREKMGNLEPVHAEGQTMVHHILRVFDLSYEYGPCIGVTRLERWERADALGLNPPPEVSLSQELLYAPIPTSPSLCLVQVKEILLTKEGSEDDEFSQCVFYGEV
ncbi:DNA polymerase delta subunit 4 [Grifola frondosa]|uniref:DNA polymerase delta subunit 4 n=1 Tax=Grifola frondosa TaxID=5627 RepID=A0A1C7MBC9_GRIFR|nr:DNA polymerase delta subunit 4 [Grifola frondosa]